MNDPKPYPSGPSGGPGGGPTVAQIAATIAVLGDDRGPLQTAARRRLLSWGDVVLPQLREAAEAEQPRIRSRCRAVLRSLEIRDLLRRVGRLRLDQLGRASAAALLDGAVLAAQMVRTFVPESRSLAAKLRREANALRRDCAGRGLPSCARLLAERLHDQLGLRGGPLAVHGGAKSELDSDLDGDDGELELDIDLVLIDRVLAKGVGAPVSLSLIYLLVARWAGLSVAGVAMPDHFLVRLHGPRSVLVDPFHGGRTITKADCARYLRANGYERVREHLRDLTDREVLIHYLRGLKRAVTKEPAPEAQDSIGEALSLLETS